MTAARYLVACALVPLLGWSLASPSVSRLRGRAARTGWAWLAGACLLTVEATLLSTAGLRWSIGLLALPLLIASAIVFLRDRKRDRRDEPFATARGATIVTIVAALHLVAAIVTTQAVSPDFLLFWAPKSVHFALARGIDHAYLVSRYGPPRADYPPLVPVMQAWGLLFSRRMPWLTAAASSALWVIAAIPVIRALLSEVTDDRAAAAVTAFWTAAMAASMSFSAGGGIGEAPLVAYLTVGALALAAGRQPRAALLIAAICFAAAALTKEEALVTIAAIVAGVLLRRGGSARAAVLVAGTAAGAGVWFLFQWRFGLPAGFHRFSTSSRMYWNNLPTIFREVPTSLSAGCWGLSWLIAAAILVIALVRRPRRVADALPLLVPIPLLLAFFVYLYLLYPADVAMRMFWILPRISQPALSLLIIGAGVVSSPRNREPVQSAAP